MHPAIRIVSLIVLGSAMALSQGRAILFATALVLALYVATSTLHLAPAWRMLKRMRWLFLSIIVFYFWFTPGEPLVAAASVWIPTVQGVVQGSMRIVALVTLVLAVNLLLQTTARPELLAGLLWITAPLCWLGVAHERLAVPLTLVLEAVPKVQALYGERSGEATGVRARLARLGDGVAALFARVLERAEQDELNPVEVLTAAHPPWYQWSVPFLIFAAMSVTLYSERLT
jgi:energy-coupling factor transport system permease protein